MSRLGTFVDKTITEDTVLNLRNCGDVFIDNTNGGMNVQFSKKIIKKGDTFRPASTAIFDGDIELKFNDVVLGTKEVYISWFRYRQTDN